ncbi:Bacterial extracellular solute-binding protein, family 3 (plasmid) [Caballeronia sp. SBC1]|uniref:transporter substrate-binding domain-containing protein n=1 Tax=Caballeronia sp. SBC1 TaxID=2705548 RepID=UPI00140F0B4F|nr:Bacterial extracellular solute-binding protein, family 3 [Caballeronia sp. SBC1]
MCRRSADCFAASYGAALTPSSTCCHGRYGVAGINTAPCSAITGAEAAYRQFPYIYGCSTNRIAFLTSKKVDLVFANFTITDERKKEVDFSTPYFASGTQFIAKKGTLKSPEQLNDLRIGADKGTTNEQQVRAQFPRATIVAYDDTPFAFAALRTGNVQAITQDGPKLVGLLANVPDRDKYEIPAFTISNDYEGVGVPKGEPRLLSFVNDTLTGLEANGTASRIYDQWFGPKSRAPLPRLFKIGDPQKS